MAKIVKSILFKLDFIGIIPQMKIFNNNIYKSLLSSIFSLIVIIFSIAFGIYSFIEFFNQNPMIDYYKTNDFITNKTIEISKSFIMFKALALDCDYENITNLTFDSIYFFSKNDWSMSLIIYLFEKILELLILKILKI